MKTPKYITRAEAIKIAKEVFDEHERLLKLGDQLDAMPDWETMFRELGTSFDKLQNKFVVAVKALQYYAKCENGQLAEKTLKEMLE